MCIFYSLHMEIFEVLSIQRSIIIIFMIPSGFKLRKAMPPFNTENHYTIQRVIWFEELLLSPLGTLSV